MARMYAWTLALALGLGGTFVMAETGFASSQLLSGKEIKSTVAGKRIYLAVPLGGELPLHYKSNGRVDGSGEAVGLGRYLAPKDSGRWWVAGNSLCQKWQKWYDGRQFCFTLEKVGPEKLRWRRDDGRSGVARIGS